MAKRCNLEDGNGAADQSDDTVLALKNATGLSKIGLALKNKSWEEGAKKGISPTQGQILTMLLNINKQRQTTISNIAEEMALTVATVSDAVKALVGKGLVVKRPSKQDKRVSVLSLTPKGKRQAQSASEWPNFLVSAIEILEESEQEVMLRGIIKIIKGLQDTGGIPVTRMCVNCKYFKVNVNEDEKKPHQCGFVNGAIGIKDIQIDCNYHVPTTREDLDVAWNAVLEL